VCCVCVCVCAMCVEIESLVTRTHKKVVVLALSSIFECLCDALTSALIFPCTDYESYTYANDRCSGMYRASCLSSCVASRNCKRKESVSCWYSCFSFLVINEDFFYLIMRFNDIRIIYMNC
jgi:hypothetical protein